MACYSPLKAYRAPGRTDAGRSRVTFKPIGGYVDTAFFVPCGQCVGCRLERSRQWALRCMYEAQLYEQNCFVTLTYSDDCLPAFGSLRFRDFQLFMKRLRKMFGSKIRFFHCGEYGESTRRPHYHAILFNFDFPDKVFHAVTRRGDRLYTSAVLGDLWPFGFGVLGSVTFESAAYVARYCLKKVTGDGAEAAYEVVDPVTGEIGRIAPEYATMSRRPGIGAGWYERFRSDVFPSDFVVHDGVRMRPPKAFDRFLERDDPDAMQRVRSGRVREARHFSDNNTPERLRVREAVKRAQISTLKRKL